VADLQDEPALRGKLQQLIVGHALEARHGHIGLITLGFVFLAVTGGEAPLLPALIVLATAATIIASQAVITGAYSLTRQAVAVGLLPRLGRLRTAFCKGPGVRSLADAIGSCVSIVGLISLT
jgi:hypothetical protein